MSCSPPPHHVWSQWFATHKGCPCAQLRRYDSKKHLRMSVYSDEGGSECVATEARLASETSSAAWDGNSKISIICRRCGCLTTILSYKYVSHTAESSGAESTGRQANSEFSLLWKRSNQPQCASSRYLECPIAIWACTTSDQELLSFDDFATADLVDQIFCAVIKAQLAKAGQIDQYCTVPHSLKVHQSLLEQAASTTKTENNSRFRSNCKWCGWVECALSVLTWEAEIYAVCA